MKLRINPKKFLVTLCVLAVLGAAYYFIFIFQTDSGFAKEQLSNMEQAEQEYKSKLGTQAAEDAIQNMRQALFEVKNKYDELKAADDESSVKEFDETVRPVYDRLKKVVEDETDEPVEDM